LKKTLSDTFVVDDETYEEIFTDRSKLNALLKTVQNDTVQGIMTTIPKILGAIIPQYVYIHAKTHEFYSNNPDLIDHRQSVGKIIDDVAAKNPKWSLDEVLEFVGGKEGDDGEVRRRLNLKKKAVEKAEKEQIKRPSFVKPAHVRQGKDEVKLTGIAKEINDMIDTTDT
jgi:Cdc6-like AAA superfamily ATPase